MATPTAAKNEPFHPPLARDAQGNLVSFPDKTAAWRICRQTTGRPKEIFGPDRKPMRFPLETTVEELVNMCGPDSYRLYAIDEVGEVLDFVVAMDVAREPRELRNSAGDASGLPAARVAPMAQMSDLRFALEAMSQMMRVNSEALRAVTESQAECFKSISSVRGYFRNASPPPPVIEVVEDDDEADEEDEPPRSKSIFDVLAPIVEQCAPAVGPLVSMLTAGAGAKTLTNAPAAANDGAPDLAAKPSWEFRDFFDMNYAARKSKAKREAKVADGGKSLQARVMGDPKLMAHFMAIKSLLSSDEAARLLTLGEHITEQEQEYLLAQISSRSPTDAAVLLRATLAELSNPSSSEPA